MSYSGRGSVREQMRFLRRPFLQDGGLPFTDILSEELDSQALKAIDGFLDRIYSPLVTLWVFLGQVLRADPHPSSGLRPPSPLAGRRDEGRCDLRFEI